MFNIIHLPRFLHTVILSLGDFRADFLPGLVSTSGMEDEEYLSDASFNLKCDLQVRLPVLQVDGQGAILVKGQKRRRIMESGHLIWKLDNLGRGRGEALKRNKVYHS